MRFTCERTFHTLVGATGSMKREASGGLVGRPVPAALRAAGAATAGDSDALAAEVNRCLIWRSPKVQLFLASGNIYLEADATLYVSEATSAMALNYVLPHACCSSHEETEPKVTIYE